MTNYHDAHGLCDLLDLSIEEFLILMGQGAFPTPLVSPRGRFYWAEGSLSEWLVLVRRFKNRSTENENPALAGPGDRNKFNG
ncbi:MAG: hypothetical protein WBG50_10110 [Desulfomonilaceae bacterium]